MHTAAIDTFTKMRQSQVRNGRGNVPVSRAIVKQEEQQQTCRTDTMRAADQRQEVHVRMGWPRNSQVHSPFCRTAHVTRNDVRFIIRVVN